LALRIADVSVRSERVGRFGAPFTPADSRCIGYMPPRFSLVPTSGDLSAIRPPPRHEPARATNCRRASHNGLVTITDERRLVTVLFADLVGTADVPFTPPLDSFPDVGAYIGGD
jgi:hypothetical protein